LCYFFAWCNQFIFWIQSTVDWKKEGSLVAQLTNYSILTIVILGFSFYLYQYPTTLTPFKNLDSKPTLAGRPSKDICNIAIKISGGKVAWDTRSEVEKFSTEAKNRGYTPEQCATFAGKITTQAGQSEAE